MGGLFGGRSVYMFAFLSVNQSVCLWSICLCAYLRASVCLYLSVCLSVCLSLSLSVCLFVVGRSVGRSVVCLSELSVSHGVHEACRQRRGEDHDAESESGRLRIQERQIGLMNVELRTGA